MAYTAHLSHTNDRTGLICMTAVFCAITITSVALRFYVRRLKRAGYGADDWLALMGSVFVLALNAIFLGGVIQHAFSGHSTVVNNQPQTTALEHLEQKYRYGFQATEKVALGLVKLSVLFLWKRLFGHVKTFAICCWVMIYLTIGWSISFFFATIFQCGTHWEWNWAPITTFLNRCTNTVDMITAFMAVDVFTDFIIMYMPVPIIWKLHMPMRNKFGVTGIFMLGFFTIGAGIARMYIYLVTSYDMTDNPDYIADSTTFIAWSDIEANIAMLVCCMPTFGPVVAQCHDSLVDHFRLARSGRWRLISRRQEGSKDGLTDTEHPSGLPMLSTPMSAAYDRASWRGDRQTVIAAGSPDLESQPYNKRGILTRTSIHRTSELRYPSK